jgi:radical SAM protein with 4Fe4S-binding SPASM domain
MKCGIRSISIEYSHECFSCTQINSDVNPDQQRNELKHFIDWYIPYIKQFSSFGKISFVSSLLKKINNANIPRGYTAPCSVGDSLLSIDYNGDLYPCIAFVGKHEFKTGHIDNLTDIEEKIPIKNIDDIPDCINCWAKFECLGGCVASNYDFTKQLHKPFEKECLIMKYNAEIYLYGLAKMKTECPWLLEKNNLPMKDVACSSVDYNLVYNGFLFRGEITLAEKSNFLKVLLPPSSILPTFKITANNNSPTERIGNVAIFKDEIFNHLKFKLYVPKSRSLYKLDEFLPKIIHPKCQSFSLSTNLPNTDCSLLNENQSEIISNAENEFFNSLISFKELEKVSFIQNQCTISIIKSPEYKPSISELSSACQEIYHRCQKLLRKNRHKCLKIYFDWSERFQVSNNFDAWNSGGLIYLLSYGYKKITPMLYITLAHEIIHEWNGREIYPSSSREWWFLEGATQVIAFKIVAASGLVKKDRIIKLILSMAGKKKINIYKMFASNLEEASLFYYESFMYALALDIYLYETSKAKLDIIDLLNILLDKYVGESFTYEDIISAIKEITKKTNEPDLSGYIQKINKTNLNKILVRVFVITTDIIYCYYGITIS